ncbi:hypothetical protein acdb102_21080 [Acidothermaceae bacterium B102]|nr:hypothetical protein acdb102_21080 [Acidothermaceae bacterium B102]
MSLVARAAAGALVLVTVLMGLTVQLPDAIAASGATGSLSFLPASGVASIPLTAVSTGVCSDPRGTNLQLRISGKGFPPGTNVTPNLKADIYPVDPSTGGYDVPLQDTLHDFAAQQNPPAVLSGRYDFTLLCKRPWGVGVYDTYAGALWFSSPTTFHALTSAAAPATPATTVPAVTSSPRPSPTRSPAPKPTSASTPLSGTPTPTHTKAPSTVTRPATPVTRTTQATASSTSRPTSVASKTLPAPTSSPVAVVTPPNAAVDATANAASPRVQPSSASPSVALVAEAISPGQASDTGWLVALAAGSLAVVVALGLVLRRRLASRGSA